MLKKMMTASLLLLALVPATTLHVRSQTRPRRVTQQTADAPAEEIAERRRAVETPTRRRGRGWMRILLGSAISIGSRMDRSCTPSRDVFRRRQNQY